MNLRLFFALLAAASLASAEDLILLDDGRSDYEIVLPNPDTLPTPELNACLQQTARLLQTAFLANGAEVPVVAEAKHDPDRPGLFLGDTQFARAEGIDPAQLRDWSYVHRAIGKNLVLAGHDHPARGEPANHRRPNWDRVGTAKAAADFAREHLGVRFLYPDIPPYNSVAAAAKIDLLASPAIEFLPLGTVAVPADLNIEKTPRLRLNTAHPAGGGFYDLAHNRFPRVDEMFGGHTWQRAAPPEKYWETHPEYFALVNGARLKPDGGNAQYCLSNPEFQELVYQDLASWLDRGYASVDLGQPDGFRACQCGACEKLYGTGDDWGEKIWIFNRQVAERLEQSHPGKDVTMMSYILTARPPKSFTAFPSNTCVMLTGTNEEDIAPWRDIAVPRGFTGYIYNWCPNLGTRYTPMRTPGFVEVQVKRLTANRIQSLHRDGPGQLFGLEGPVYYVMGRMFDDPERNAAKDLIPEFCEAAFGNPSAAFSMRSFYSQLYHAIALYSDHIGTRCDVWTYQPLPGERPRKTVQDPFQLIAFLYPPNLLAALDEDLSRAEQAAPAGKARTRLALVRREFEYVRHFAKVVHLHQAYLIAPDAASRDRLLDAIDARNAFVDGLYDSRGQGVASGNWSYVLFPYPGHNAAHLRLAYDGYQEPYANTCFNWDTDAMRRAPVPGKKRLSIAKTAAKLTLDSPEWQDAAAHELTLVPPLHTLPRKTTVRLLYGEKALHIRAEAEIGAEAGFAAFDRDRVLTNQEAFDVYLAPHAVEPLFYRFTQGANAASKYDALNGRISDAMDPRYGKDDPAWNGDWTSETRVDAAKQRWLAHLVIPFAALGVEPPAKGTVWRANFGRNHLLPRGKMDRAVWSASSTSMSMDDRGVMGEITFE